MNAREAALWEGPSRSTTKSGLFVVRTSPEISLAASSSDLIRVGIAIEPIVPNPSRNAMSNSGDLRAAASIRE